MKPPLPWKMSGCALGKYVAMLKSKSLEGTLNLGRIHGM